VAKEAYRCRISRQAGDEGTFRNWLLFLALVPAVGLVAIALDAGSVHGANTP
jgi:hypothetical protein